MASPPPYQPFSELPEIGDPNQIPVDSNTAITVPLRKKSNLAKDYLPAGSHALTLNSTTNQWSKSETIEPGRGYFVQGKAGSLLVDGKPLPAKSFDISLKRGWNVIGNPFLSPVVVEQISVTVDGRTMPFWEAVKKGWIADYLYGYVDGKWYVSSVFEPGLALPPWRGIYLLSTVDAILTIASAAVQ